MKSIATVCLTVGMVLLGFPITEVLVWACAIVGAFVFSNVVTGLIWEALVWRAQKS